MKRPGLYFALAVVVLLGGGCQCAWSQDRSPIAAQAAGSDDAVWKAFEDFAKGQDGPAVVTAYRKKLISDGLTEQQAWDHVFRLDEIRKKRRADAWATHFNRLYTTDQDVFTTAPNAFLASIVRDLRPGTALDVGMGQGRNTVFLASKGWQATGFDPAEEGLKVAQADAARAGVKITTVKAGWEDFDFGKERWDLILFCYAIAPLSDQKFVTRIRSSLKPGGLVVIEHPMNDPDLAMHAQDVPNALPRAYSQGFRILFYEDTIGVSEWQQSNVKRTDDPRRMVRFVARKDGL